MTDRGYGLIDTILWSSLYTCTSFFFFTALSSFLDSYVLPDHLRQSQKKSWKWVNYAVSWVHSTLSGSLGVLCLCLTPSLLDNLILEYSETAYISICISYGYFLHDTLDIINNHDKDKANGELVIHHTFAITSAALVVYTKTYVAFTALALLIELHSSVLHSRVLFKMYHGASVDLNNSKCYTWIKMTNIVFFFLFRFSALFFNFYGLIRDYNSAPNMPIYYFLCLTTAVILFLSILLFKRVYQADFIDIKTSSLCKAPQDKVFQSVLKGDEAPSINSIVVTAAPLEQSQPIHSLLDAKSDLRRQSRTSSILNSQSSSVTDIAMISNNVSSK